MATATQLPPIPVVNNVITDEEVLFNTTESKNMQTLKHIPVSVAKTHKLICDKHSRGLAERHARAVHRLTKHFNRGFLMKDLNMISDIFTACTQRLQSEPLYEKALCQLIKICGFPFLKEKSSDEALYAEAIISLLTEMGEAMKINNKTIQLELANALTRLYCSSTPQHMINDCQVPNPQFIKSQIEKSGIARSLVECLEFLQDLETRLEVMRVLQHYSCSALNCDDMLSVSCAGLICSSLNLPDPSGRLVFLSVEILWNLLEQGSKQVVSDQLNCKECIGALKDGFLKQIKEGYSHADRQLRNDLLVISSLVASCCADAPFVETGFTKVLVLFATFTEVKSHNPLVRNFKLYQNHEDFELKKLLMNTLILLSHDCTASQIMSEGRVLLSLLEYVKPNDNLSSPDWSPAQFEELQLQALDTLCTIGPLCIEDYMTCQGNTRLLMLLEWCVGQADYGGHGNSYHGSGGRGNKRAQMRFVLRLLRSMVSVGDEGVNQDCIDQGAIHQLVGILLNASTSPDDNDVIDIEMQCDMLIIVSTLCEGDIHRKELFGVSGVQVVIEYLKKDPSKINSPLGHHKLLLATVDCIWSAVLGSFITEQVFLESEGIFYLLDLLEVCPSTMQHLVLGCLVDLCENQKVLPHVLAWRGKQEITVSKLLVNLWKKEEASMGVLRDSTGAIADPKKPLEGRLQERQGVIPLPADRPSQSIVDVSENMRAKIFSMFCKIGFNALPGLSTADYVTIALIEKYLDFKMGEVWQEIKVELEQENIRPVTPDAECLNEITKLLDERANDVAAAQVQLMQTQKNQDLIEEEEQYEMIKENHRQEEKAYRDFCDFVTRTSDYTVLKGAGSYDSSRKLAGHDVLRSKHRDRKHTARNHQVCPPVRRR
ncbi:cilia- and flagella-associated protein 69 isoform X2 [Nematostella vectensis]|uniref:cilia- and flagella-associated protein 69 isoform X2 n=1 Tax=Nematostella vectensis TaxID=45351 RepID=UPI002077445E|nr:cilia- and flagella-associated protein 69 isoform X2 [Nematostella vectensis]